MSVLMLSGMRAAIGLLLAACAGSACADEWSEPYPWETRPLKCRVPEAQGVAMCEPKHWTSWDGTLQRLQQLGQAEQFTLLDRALRDLATSRDLFPDGTYKATAVRAALKTIVDQAAVAPPADQVLEKWRRANPGSDFVLLADVLAKYQSAWDARGTGYASSVSPESWELFAMRLREAESSLLKAPVALQDTAVWYHLLLQVAMESRGTTRWEPVFLKAVERWPLYLNFYTIVSRRLLPKWGGSWEAVEAFIDRSSRQVAATEGMSFYARLYAALGNDVIPAQPALDWPKMQVGFEDWIARVPSPFAKNRYASHACFARDKAAFRKAMGQISQEEYEPSAWLNGYSSESCSRWAES